MSFDGLALTILAVLAGIFVGLARGGRFRNVVGITVRAKGLLVIGVVVPALADQFTREVAVPLVVGGLAALLAFAIVNVRIVGMSVMAVGIVANLLATFLNGGLPVSRDALVEAGLATRAEVDRVELRGARRLEEPTHRLRFLGDIIPLEATNQVLAFGDLVILVGLADITANLTLRKRRRSGADAKDDAGEHDIAVIDLVRLHEPHGAPNPRPHAPVHLALDAAAVAEPEAEPTGAPDELVASSPDVEWWPAAVRLAPGAELDVDLTDAELADAEPADAELAEADLGADAEATDGDASFALAETAPELVEEEPIVDWVELEAEVVREPAEAAGPRDATDDGEVWADVDPELHQEPATEPRVARDDLPELEPVAARPRRIDLDLDLRWAPEPEEHIDLRDLPEPAWPRSPVRSIDQVRSTEPAWSTEPEVEGSAGEVQPRWATAEPQWAEATEARPGDEVAVAPARDASPVVTGDDDDLFHLLFADLKPRRSRRRGERTIPDFEPVHVDDDAITPRRR